MGERSATQWPLRAGVLVAVASTALLMQRAAIAGNRLSSGAWGAVVARFDLAVPLIIALVAFVAARRSLADRSSVRYGIGWLPAIYVGWALTVLFAKAALHVQGSPGRFLATLVFFRTGGTPLPGLGAGPLLLTLSLTVVVMPLLVRFTRGPFVRARPWLIPLCLAAVALLYRVVCTVAGRTDLFGPLSWLPNHLDLVGLGLAVALIDERSPMSTCEGACDSVGSWSP